MKFSELPTNFIINLPIPIERLFDFSIDLYEFFYNKFKL